MSFMQIKSIVASMVSLVFQRGLGPNLLNALGVMGFDLLFPKVFNRMGGLTSNSYTMDLYKWD
jgi:hypothetical protein